MIHRNKSSISTELWRLGIGWVECQGCIFVKKVIFWGYLLTYNYTWLLSPVQRQKIEDLQNQQEAHKMIIRWFKEDFKSNLESFAWNGSPLKRSSGLNFPFQSQQWREGGKYFPNPLTQMMQGLKTFAQDNFQIWLFTFETDICTVKLEGWYCY